MHDIIALFVKNTFIRRCFSSVNIGKCWLICNINKSFRNTEIKPKETVVSHWILTRKLSKNIMHERLFTSRRWKVKCVSWWKIYRDNNPGFPASTTKAFRSLIYIHGFIIAIFLRCFMWKSTKISLIHN